MSEFIHDLETPNPEYLDAKHLPIIERNPILFWKTLCAILTVIIIILLYIINSQ